MKYYTIYEIKNRINNKKYIGCHMTNNIDDGYMGSGKLIKLAIKKYGIENFEKTILFFCNSEKEMIDKEIELVNEDIVNSKEYYNLTIGGSNFYHINSNLDKYRAFFMNKVVVKDKDNNIFKVSKDDERYLNGELVSKLKGLVLVKDKDNNQFFVDKNDKRYLNGELVSKLKGLILVKDENENYFFVDKNDERYLNGILKFSWFGKKHNNETKKKIGEKNSISQNGEKNSQYGTCWIILETEKRCIKINKSELIDYLNNGWKKGRKMNWKN